MARTLVVIVLYSQELQLWGFDKWSGLTKVCDDIILYIYINVKSSTLHKKYGSGKSGKFD